MPFPVLTEWLVNNVFALIPVAKIHSYEKGVKFRFGKDIGELKYGIYLYVPYFESIEIVDTQQKPLNLVSQSITTKDYKSVTFSCNLIYHVRNARKNFTVVHDFDHSLTALVMTVVADVTSSHTFKQLVDDKCEIEATILDIIGKRIVKWGAVADEFGYTDLVEAKQYRFFGDPPAV